METHENDVETELGIPMNRTGIMTHPELSAELIQAAQQMKPTSEGDTTALASLRAPYLQEPLPIGSPPPLLLDMAEDGANLGQLEGLTVLLDKLGERLAFERQGARLYQTFMQKCELLSANDASAPSLEELRRICDEELEHFRMLQKAITQLGGDPTVKTPCADIVGVMSKGVLEIVNDPRTTVPQSLQAVLTAELVDNDGWQMLQDLAAELGQDDLEKQCRRAFEQEQEHLDKVREWLMALTMDEASVGMGEAQMEADETEIEEKKPAKRSTRSRQSKSSSSRSSKSTSKKKKRK